MSLEAPRNGRWTAFSKLFTIRMKELKREPEVVFWVFVLPFLLALGLGLAFGNRSVKPTSVVIVADPAAQRALQALKDPREIPSIHVDVANAEEAEQGFRMGKYDLEIRTIPSGGVSYVYDPTRTESLLSERQVDDLLQAAAGRRNPLPTFAVVSGSPGSRYIDFLIPGLIGMNVMNTAMWGMFAVVDMRQRKLLKRLFATPMRRTDFLLSLIASRLLLVVAEIALLFGLGVFFFNVRLLGNWFTILLIGATGAICFAALGLLTACRAQKLETASGIINLALMPMWLFSGIFFSYQRFPAILHPFIKALPLTALNDALRDVALQGASLISQTGRLSVLAVWGLLCFGIALRYFRWA